MDEREIKDLTISALVISLAFGIALSNGIFSKNLIAIIPAFILSLVTVSLSFILHELGHRTIAKYFGLHAIYKKWNNGLKMALLFSLFGFVFAAPGAVVIHAKADLWGRMKRVGYDVNGLISAAGPSINIVLALFFLLLGFLAPFLNNIVLFGVTLSFITYGVQINSWLAFFNLIPFGPLDGSKIFNWNRNVWIVLIGISLGLMLF